MKTLRNCIIALAFVATASPSAMLAQATTTDSAKVVSATPTSSRPVWAYVRVAGESGGDALGTIYFSNGTQSEVQAGGGIDIVGGMVFRAISTNAGGLDAQLGAGIKWRTIPDNTNQSASWLRVPVDASLAWRASNGFGLGAGTTVHLANKFTAEGSALNTSVSFDPSFGKVAFLEYGRRDWQVDLRYTHVKYTSSNPRGTLDASNIGVGFTWQFAR